MRKYKCSCGIILDNFGSLKKHVEYHKKYYPCYIIYRLTWWKKLLCFLFNHWEKVLGLIGYLLVFSVIMFHDNSYKLWELLLVGIGMGFVI